MQEDPQAKELLKRLREAKVAAGLEVEKAQSSAIASVTRLSLDLVAGFGVGLFLGFQLDNYFGSLPLFMIILSILGMVAGFWSFYKILLKQLAQEQDSGSNNNDNNDNK